MADALISVVLEQLASYVRDEVTLVVDTREEVLKLTSTLKLVQAVLSDADEKQVKENSVKVWLGDLKQVVYDADDVLDEWRTRAAISQLQSDAVVVAGTRKKVLSFCLSPCFCFKRAIVRYDIGQQIRDINKRLDVIAKQKEQFGLNAKIVYQNHDEPRRLTSSVVDASKIHGRDKAKEEIMNRLLGESSSEGRALRVIAIVGIGGLGKTTLGKLIFNEERVTDIFKTKMWVCVSEPFNLVGVAKAIIKETGGGVSDSSTEWEEVHKCLCQSVKGKQFLLVLDDVWTEDPSHWKELKLALDGGAPGSRIIVTTRNRTVAKVMGSTDSDIHDLEKLSDDDSWSVLKDVALAGKEKDLEKFEKMGKEIAIKCKGVPLAITTLASLLYERQTKEGWKNVLASDLWEVPQIEQFFLPSLFLSYFSLSPISKQCFLYCACFPKDAKMPKDDLIKLWMAQGFFGYSKTSDLERIGENHFHILAMRSFFQDFEKDSDGNITGCKMHDLVHDFAMYLSQNESVVSKAVDTKFDSDKIRHLIAADLENPLILKAKNLRTLALETAVPSELFDKLTCLRTLIMVGSSVEVLPNEVGKLVHLRYLNLSGAVLLELPESICDLYDLQFLALDECENLRKLPENIGKLCNLRHLGIEGTSSLGYFPKTFAVLSSLRTLSKFNVSDVDDGCKIGDLQLLNNLQGALELNGLSRVTDEKDAIRAKLNTKRNLRKLTFNFEELISDSEEESGITIRMKNILEKLEPHEDLEILNINGYPAVQFPGWVQSCSLNIVKMSLSKCEHCTELPAFGKLASLETLVIETMGSVTRIGNEFHGPFPKLKVLKIKNMEKLEEWEVPVSKDTKIMPLLVEIELINCPMLRALPHVWKMESLEVLSLSNLPSVERVGLEFLGVGSLLQDGVTFPKLKELYISYMNGLEEWSVPFIMPCLKKLGLYGFPKLKTLPTFACMKTLESLLIISMKEWEGQEKLVVDEKEGSRGDSCLRDLLISRCPKLHVVPDYMFSPSLEELILSGDVGDLFNSFPAYSTCAITHVYIYSLPHSWLPKGFNQLKALQQLWFFNCETLDFDLKELLYFTMLRDLTIYECPILKERFKGDDWKTILAHVSRIIINDVEITNKG